MLFLNLSDTISQKALLRTAIRNSAFVILFSFYYVPLKYRPFMAVLLIR